MDRVEVLWGKGLKYEVTRCRPKHMGVRGLGKGAGTSNVRGLISCLKGKYISGRRERVESYARLGEIWGVESVNGPRHG